jgi:hypothetical protein
MNRSLAILVGALALAAVIFAGAYETARHATVACCVRPSDDLDWLRTEFHLSDTELARIRQLHEGYLPQCAAICTRIAAGQQAVATLLDGRTNVTAEAQAKMNELAALRAQCQAQMLQHFMAVSQAMPPAEGQRYLAEMKRLTLGDDGPMAQMTSGDSGHEHHH